MHITKSKMVFGPGLGGPSEYYRIPSMVVTKSGVVVACADARYFTGRDNPNRIEKAVRRSTDSGDTWGEFIIVNSEVGESKKESSAAIDPVMVYVASMNRIYMMYCHTPAGVGILNCQCTTGEDTEGHKIIQSGRKKYILKNDRLYTMKGRLTPYEVDPQGTVSENGREICNLYIGNEFKVRSTAFLMLTYSDDEGLTWSKPVSINHQVKRSYMSFIGPGPGVGIVVEEGDYKGRIIVPIYYGTAKWPLMLSCCVIYSDDNGVTWQLGETPNNTRRIGRFKASDRFIMNHQMLTESQLIEQKGGVLKYFMRNHDKRRRLAVAYSHNGGASWEGFRWDESLPQPICQVSVIRLNGREKDYVVLLNPANEKERADGTVRLSEDGGETFPYQRMVKKGPFVYSCLAQLPDGNIGAMYEPNLECEQIDFVKFSLDWIKEGD